MKRFFLLVTLLVFFSFIFLYSVNVFSRAGGGHSYSGSSSSSSRSSSSSTSRSSYSSSKSYRSSSGGSGGGSAVGAIIAFLFIGGIVLIVALTSRRVLGANQYNDTLGRANGVSEALKLRTRAENISKIKSLDPGFSEEKFIERAKQAFLTVQKGWSEQNMSLMKSFVSNGIFARFSVQIEMQRYLGYRNQLDNIRILNASIDTVYSDNLYDVINVRFNAVMDDKNVDIKTGNVLSINTSEPFTEYWTFVRRKGATTPGKAGLIENKCPNCGADIKITESGSCEFCKSYIMGGQYDWVLTEITQECEYNPFPSQYVTGLQEMTERDPDFNVAVIEDKASVMFFKIIGTLLFGNPKYIKGFCHPWFINQLKESPQWSPLFDEQSDWYPSVDDAAVGTVELKRITINGADGFDRADIMVKWSGSNCERNRKTRQIRNTIPNMVRIQTYTLVRKSAVKSSAFYNFKMIPCNNCGAPLSDNITEVCEFCNTPVNDGKRDWVLYEISPYRPFDYQSPGVQLQKSPLENRVIMSAIAAGVMADGRIDESEKKSLDDIARSRGISEKEMLTIIESVRSGYALGMPLNPAEAERLTGQITEMLLSDGVLSDDEYRIVISFATRFGIGKGRADKIINEKKRLIYKEAKQLIKNI
ncbi:MAG: TIM44-like domain-containing protein [Deltaproteobacteria bacterium]|nr:TIM44-like domain-containing protein [Deltaproteobacteria bacterium]